MKCDRCYFLDFFYNQEKIQKRRCLKNNEINESGCSEFMEID